MSKLSTWYHEKVSPNRESAAGHRETIVAFRENRADAKANRERKSAERHATMKIGGKAWWKSDRAGLVIVYEDIDVLNRELRFASEDGWYIADTDADGGHVNIGRTATKAILTGGVGLMFGGSRSKAKTTISWRRDAS